MPADQILPTPIPDSYWVVPGRLCAGAYPGAAEAAETRRKLRLFLHTGFTFFLDLTEGRDLAPYAALLREEAATQGMVVEHRRMAIRDLGTPAPAETRRMLDTIDAALAAGHRIYVHCYGGIGRTGTIVGCYLVRHGLMGDQALAQIERLRLGIPDAWKTSPETPEQQERVRSWPVGG